MPDSLEQCWPLWIAKARELTAAGIPCCAPFISWKPIGYDDCPHRILLVGKATNGWYWQDRDISSRLSNDELAIHQQKASQMYRFDQQHPENRRGGFWDFLRKTASVFGDSSIDPTNLIWSNLFKIGNKLGNPDKNSTKMQTPLAVETLRLEILEYKPTLVIFTTAFHDKRYVDVVYEAAGLNYKDRWIPELEGKPEESWALSVESKPAMLWVKHPAYKSNQITDAWLRRAKVLST